METKHGHDARQKVWDMIKDIKVTLMATHDVEGALHARPMVARQEDFDGTLWFFSRADSRKIQEITHNPTILLNYSDPEHQNYVAITGTADIVRDREIIKDLWSEGMRTWFPDGAEDPNLVAIRVSAESAEYWDSPSSALVYAYGYVKARLTGESPKPGDVGKVSLVGGI